MRSILLRTFVASLAYLYLCGCSLSATMFGSHENSESPPPVSYKTEYCFDGTVQSEITLENGHKVVGGDFVSVGKCSNPTLRVNLSTNKIADIIAAPRAIQGYVYAIEPDGHGGYYLGGGFFATAGEETLVSLVHINANGTISDWNANLKADGGPAEVNTLKLHNGILYVGGNFTSAGSADSPRVALAAFDTATGLLTAWDPGVTPASGSGDAFVNHISIHDNRLYVGGEFDSAGRNGVTNPFLAALNLNNNEALATFTPQPDRKVFKVLGHGNLLYVSGPFSTIGGANTSFAAIDPTTGADSGWNWQSHMDPVGFASITSFDISGDTLWVGGNFSGYDALTTVGIASFDISGALPSIRTWSNVGHEPDGLVMNIFASQDHLLIVGSFRNIGSMQAKGSAILKTTDGSLAYSEQLPEDIYHAYFENGQLISVGSFDRVSVKSREYLVMIDPAGDITSWNPSPNGRVITLFATGTTIFAGGTFTEIGATPVPRDYVAEIDFSGEATPWEAHADGVVSSVKLHQGFLWMSGSFSSVGSPAVARNFIAKLNPTTGAVENWDAQVTGTRVLDFDFVGDKIVIGGNFSQVQGDATAARLAALDVETAALSAWRPQPDSIVEKVLTDGTNVIIAGQFEQVGPSATPRNTLAKLSLTSDEPLAWDPGIEIGGLYGMSLRNKELNIIGYIQNVHGAPYEGGALVACDSDSGEIIESSLPYVSAIAI
ncbi:hypothetical protein QJS83_07055 [Bdellovibrio sp. 22V]|uniref:hypothetical protein n=1 Tax=Bdellovibrio sp. 22V TaxID=3044166 RepID=UPI002543A5B8|nr:hypothetical protein [Bdellovibrio sp. 22V]WII73630.1 hypothetical protein QJS83_07055 [Bdellovibrio sp. 22V]